MFEAHIDVASDSLDELYAFLEEAERRGVTLRFASFTAPTGWPEFVACHAFRSELERFLRQVYCANDDHSFDALEIKYVEER